MSDPSSTGSQADMVARMRAVIASSWFPITPPGATISAAPILDSLLSGIGWAWSYCYNLANYAILQARIGTATGGFLDMICSDFFGTIVMRQTDEADDALRVRIRANLLLAKATRFALSDAVKALVGRSPAIFEPRRAADTGGYAGTVTPAAGGGGGYGTALLYHGSRDLPFQYLVKAFSNSSWNTRATVATYIDGMGVMKVTSSYSVRPSYLDGVSQGPLLEARGFNLIKDSIGWSSCAPASLGAPAQWFIDLTGAEAVLPGQPVLRVSVNGSTSFSGPLLAAWSDVGPVTGSAWLMLPDDHELHALSLELSDVTGVADPVSIAPDLTATGVWQRVSVTLLATGQAGRQLRLRLAGVATGPGATTTLLTQCWQIEQGLTATSFIPSDGQIGMRDRDELVVLDSLPDSIVDSYSLQQVVDRVAPAGSIAWMTVLQ